MGRRARLFVLSGPSGAGKGTLVTEVRALRPDLALTVSATTRKPREGEIPGVSYHYLSDEEFTRRVDAGEFVEWDFHFDHRYGTLWSEVNQHLDQGHSVIVEIDVNGALNVKAQLPEAVLVFISPPSIEELEARLRKRGAEDEEQIALRLSRVEMEMERAELYDAVVINDVLTRATHELLDIIERFETDGG